MRKMTEKVETKYLKDTGMLLYINQIIQPFGLSLGYVPETDTLIVLKSKFRGFSQQAVEKAYDNINTYLKDNIDEITDI